MANKQTVSFTDSDLFSAAMQISNEGMCIVELRKESTEGGEASWKAYYNRINDQSGQIVGRDVADFLGTEVGLRVHPDDQQYSIALGIKAVSEGHSQGEFRVYPDADLDETGKLIIKENERMIFVSVKLSFLAGDDTVKYILLMVNDITESVRMEKMTDLVMKLAFELHKAKTYNQVLKHVLAGLKELGEITGEKFSAAGLYFWLTDGSLRLVADQGFLTKSFLALIQLIAKDDRRIDLVASGNPIYLAYQASELASDDIRKAEGLLGLAVIPIPEIGALNIGSHYISEFSEVAKKFIETISSQLPGVISRVKAEEQVRQSEKHQQSIMDTVTDVMFVLEADGTVVFANKAASLMLNTPASDLGKVKFFDFLKPGDVTRAQLLFKKILQAPGTVLHEELLIVSREGKEIPVDVLANVLHIDTVEGKKELIVGIARDIRLNKELVAMEQEFMIYQSLASLGELTAKLIHDINNILTKVWGTAEMNSRNLIDVKQLLTSIQQKCLIYHSSLPGSTAFLDEVNPLLAQVIGLIEKVLKLEKGLARNGQEASDFIDESLALLKGHQAPKEILDLGSLLPDIMSRSNASHLGRFIKTVNVAKVYAQKSQLSMFVLNMINNAWDASKANKEEIRIVLSLEEATLRREDIPLELEGVLPGDFYKITIRDNGCGMTSEVSGKIFTRLFTYGKGSKGTGMGLAGLKKFITDHDGMVFCESEVGHGSTFTIFLPKVS